MSSTIGVQNIAHTNGTNAMTVSSGGVVTATSAIRAPGAVLQVIAGYATSETSNNSVTYVATPLFATITPSSTSSKILIQTSGGYLYVPGNGTGFMTIYRDSTNLNTLAGTPSDSFVRATGYAGQNMSVPVNMQVLDSPNTTSAITYKVYMRSSDTGYMLQFGNHGVDNSQMILMEIGG